MNREIFHKDFKAQPFWWEVHRPSALPELTLPREARAVIVGAGYA